MLYWSSFEELHEIATLNLVKALKYKDNTIVRLQGINVVTTDTRLKPCSHVICCQQWEFTLKTYYERWGLHQIRQISAYNLDPLQSRINTTQDSSVSRHNDKDKALFICRVLHHSIKPYTGFVLVRALERNMDKALFGCMYSNLHKILSCQGIKNMYYVMPTANQIETINHRKSDMVALRLAEQMGKAIWN